ncbi:Replication-associated recombination protein RarA [hydrothermal vent metagenome]|uniref:Replication-associated recombination protein RarA n=1 Tax=hydrothermal vent metagenome TaxID=652676 RepID=A0A3B1ASV2_9ZZZZ
MQKNLFKSNSNNNVPLAYQLRPTDKENYIGFTTLEKKYPFLESPIPISMIIWGPAGCGKTTLAHILLSNKENIEFLAFSAVLSGLTELKKLFEQAREVANVYHRTPVIFIDEIHRFNKAQQDALLPHVESGLFTLIGATTENPRNSVNKALLSRMQIVELKPINYLDSINIINGAMNKLNIKFNDNEVELMAEYSGGDARKAINNLEMAINLKQQNQFNLASFKQIILENARSYDRNKDRHYDVISAFIKSMRGSDPDAALLWLAIMLDGGEDPVFIARRLVIFASEDVGNADIHALTIANNALNVVSLIGMPEARITLSQATTYLASTVKSNAAYKAINEALEYVQSQKTIEVPEHLKNFPIPNHPYKYQYPHVFEGAFVEQQYAPLNSPQFYKPHDTGVEKKIKNRLASLWPNTKNYND